MTKDRLTSPARLRYAQPRDWWMLSGALTGSILTGLTYSLHCYTEGGISDALMEGQFQYHNGTLWENMDVFRQNYGLLMAIFLPRLRGICDCYDGAHRLSKSVRQEMDAYANAGGVAEEVISGIRTVGSFNAQEFEAKRSGTVLTLKGEMTPGSLFGVVWLIVDAAFKLGRAIIIIATKMAAGEIFSIIGQVTVLLYGPVLQCRRILGQNICSILFQKPFIDSSSSSGMKI
ncbi:ABC transporter transmembrane region domain-containing protein [Ditylenchus destructor]|uniref:ABC transporter transmembrane region domain-containing protein n=1 Tax=Ditylenchus destructor TaxID=166010 RepID=A0AAD4MV73_9BILA|nr:ABC transporter transmembrane region domain-containing protein [Ditylenchus destructor]